MWRRLIARTATRHPWRTIFSEASFSTKISASAVDSLLLRSLKDHYVEVSKMALPSKVSTPSAFEVLKGSLDAVGPVLHRTYGHEEINIYVMRMADIGQGEEDDEMSPLLVDVDISKPGQTQSLHFFCGLYQDALGIHSVSLRPKPEKSGFVVTTPMYSGPSFEDIDEKMREELHKYIEERGINESLFPFLQAWLYVKEHRKLLRWFKSVGTFIHEKSPALEA